MTSDSLRRLFARIGELARDDDEPSREMVGELLGMILEERILDLTDFLYRAVDGVVQSGPFTGMSYLPEAAGSLLTPKLLGCYESELHDTLRQIAEGPYHTIINIGCGEGFYAVGLARLLPAARVYAFDTDKRARKLCRQLATLNGVENRVVVSAVCGPSQLEPLTGRRTLLVSDCEGGEVTLLDPILVPGLESCDLLVELHDFLDPRTSHIVCNRFAGTHMVTLVHQAGRNPHSFALLRGLSDLDKYLAVWEGRPGPTPWAYMSALPAPADD